MRRASRVTWNMGVDNGLYTVLVVDSHGRLGVLGLLMVAGVVGLDKLGEERCILAALGLEIILTGGLT